MYVLHLAKSHLKSTESIRIYIILYQSLWDKVKTDEMVSPLRFDQLVCRKENLQLLHVMGDGPSITLERGDLSP